MTQVEFFFDCSSPWTYLAFHNYQPIAERYNIDTQWRPILVGGIFNTINPTVYASRENPVPAKKDYQAKDIADWARHAGLTIKHPPTIFPVNSVKAMRGCLIAAYKGCLVAYAKATFEIYWGEDQDIRQDAVLAEIANRAGLDAQWMAESITDDEVKRVLRQNTEELISRGGFGSPTIFVNGNDMYFGNDRLVLVESALKAVSDK